MAHHRGRGHTHYASDDSEHESEYLQYPEVSRARSRSRSRVNFVEDARYATQVARQPLYRGRSERLPGEIVAVGGLAVPTSRQRVSSTGGSPRPNLLQSVVVPVRDVSQTRVRHYHEHRHYSEDDSDESHHKSRSRHRSSVEKISNETAARLARLQLLEEQNNQILRDQQLYGRDPRRTSGYELELASKIARLEALEAENHRKPSYGQDSTAEQLARLKLLEDKRRQHDEEELWEAKLEDRHRRAESERKRIQAEVDAKRRQDEADEADIIAKAEARRRTKEEAAKAEKQRLLLDERERVRREKEEHEDERRRILAEEEDRKKKKKAEEEETRQKVLAEEAERIAKEKQKAKEEDEKFHAKVREKFVKAGYSPDYIDDVLDEKKKRNRSHGETEMALDLQRPTYIRVQIKHLLPETLDHYRLPWDYDPEDRRYIIIRKYIAHDPLQELFDHTARIYKKRETYLLEDGDGYTKTTETTTTTLRPGVVRHRSTSKGRDDIMLVRSKSKSKSDKTPRSWIFT